MKTLNKAVQEELVILFEHLADAVDGEERLPKHLEDAYHKAFNNKCI